MNKEEFIDLVWRLEEMLNHVDYLNTQIGNCGGQCGGLDAEEDEGLCPACCDIFAKVLAEEERLEKDQEYNKVLRKLKEACDEDKSGEYRSILNQLEESKAFH